MHWWEYGMPRRGPERDRRVGTKRPYWRDRYDQLVQEVLAAQDPTDMLALRKRLLSAGAYVGEGRDQ